MYRKDRTMLFTYEQLHSTQNHRLTKALFFETASDTSSAIMTLSRKPKRGLVCLRDLFLELTVDDPSEYEFAEHVFGDYAHWKLISDTAWMKPYLEEWRMVADVKRKSKAFKSVVREVDEGGRNSYTAAKYLIEEPWKDKRRKGVKEQVEATKERASSAVASDFERIKEMMKG